MVNAHLMKNSQMVLNVIESLQGDASPVTVVRAAASSPQNGMDMRAAEDALCVLFETGRVYTNDDMNLVIRAD